MFTAKRFELKHARVQSENRKKYIREERHFRISKNLFVNSNMYKYKNYCAPNRTNPHRKTFQKGEGVLRAFCVLFREIQTSTEGEPGIWLRGHAAF